MEFARKKLVTIICEAGLEARIGDDVERLGAHGYTVSDARGRGARGTREAGWPASGNVRVEVICEEVVARAIVEHLQARYFDHYAMVLHVTDVEVLRPAKF